MRPSYTPVEFPKQHQPQLALRRDTAVVCPSCGRRVVRRARSQLYCSPRCRKRGAYARNVATGVFSRAMGRDTPLGTHPPKNINQLKAQEVADSRSRVRIKGPRAVIEIEVFPAATWRTVTSSDGVACQVSRALVDGGAP